LQLPNVQDPDIDAFSPPNKNLTDIVDVLQPKNDERTENVRKALEKWGRIEIVDAVFKGK
jgi:translocation protein SEC63